MVESICGQGFAYAHEAEEDLAKHLVKLGQKGAIEKTACGAETNQKIRLRSLVHHLSFIGVWYDALE
jgi:hypothetical protein